jgi:hypothetical protein
MATCAMAGCQTPRPKGVGAWWICPPCRALLERANAVRRLLRNDPQVDPLLALSYVIAPPS